MDDNLKTRIDEAKDVAVELRNKYIRQSEITEVDWKKLIKSINDISYLLNYIQEQIG